MYQHDDLWLDYIDKDENKSNKSFNAKCIFKKDLSVVAPMSSSSNVNMTSKFHIFSSQLLTDCPPSLQFLMKFYRLTGFSFSGLLFASHSTSNNRKWLTKLASTLLIFINLAMIILAIITVLIPSNSNEKSSSTHSHPNETNFVSILFYEMTEGIVEYRKGFAHFKPILRATLTAVVYIFSAEGAASFTVNLLIGGQQVRCLTEVTRSYNNKIQLSKSFTVKLIILSIASSYLLHAFGMLLFSGGRFLRGIFAMLGLVEITEGVEEAFYTKRLFVMTIMHGGNSLAASLTPVLFLYSMITFQKAIEYLDDELVGKNDNKKENENDKILTETDLQLLKSRLTSLAEHFHRLLGLFGAPISIVNVSSVYQITACSCYLMINGQLINDGNGMTLPQGGHYFRPLMFNFLIFSLLRLGVLCYAGNLLSIAAQELLRSTYEHLPAEPTLEEWMLFGELRRLLTGSKDEGGDDDGAFQATLVANTYSVRQASLLHLLGFALSYTVVLLQTENYGSTTSDDRLLENASFFNSSVQQ